MVEPSHDLAAEDDGALPVLVARDFRIGFDRDDGECESVTVPCFAPDASEVEEIAVVERDFVALIAFADVEFTGRDQAAVIRELFALGADELERGLTRIACFKAPTGLDEFDLVGLFGIAADDGAREPGRRIRIKGACVHGLEHKRNIDWGQWDVLRALHVQ